MRILSIDAWRTSDGGWQWNNWHSIGTIAAEDIPQGTRALLAKLRALGYLSAYSKGRVAVEDDGFNIVITDRGNGRPLYALEYGADPFV